MDSVLKTGIVLREAIDSENEIISPSSSSFRIMHDEQASTSGKGYLDWLEESDEDDDGAAKLAKNDPKGEANAGSGNKEKLGSQREYQYGQSQYLSPEVLSRAIYLAMEEQQEQQNKRVRLSPEVISYQAAIIYDSDEIMRDWLTRGDQEKYKSGAEIPSKEKKSICRQHCLFLYQTNRAQQKGQPKEFYPSTSLKAQLARHLIQTYPDLSDSDGGHSSLFYTKPRQGGSITKCLEHLNTKYKVSIENRVQKKRIGREAPRRKLYEGSADPYDAYVKKIAMLPANHSEVDHLMQQTFDQRRIWIEGTKGPTIPEILQKFHVLLTRDQIEKEFERILPMPGSFQAAFEKLRVVTGMINDNDVNSLSKALFAKRCKKLIVSRVTLSGALKENSALRLVEEESSGVFFLLIIDNNISVNGLSDGLELLMKASFVFHARYNECHLPVCAILERIWLGKRGITPLSTQSDAILKKIKMKNT